MIAEPFNTEILLVFYDFLEALHIEPAALLTLGDGKVITAIKEIEYVIMQSTLTAKTEDNLLDN